MKKESIDEMMNVGLAIFHCLPEKVCRLSNSGAPVIGDNLDRYGNHIPINYAIERNTKPLARVAFTGCPVLLRNSLVTKHMCIYILKLVATMKIFWIKRTCFVSNMAIILVNIDQSCGETKFVPVKSVLKIYVDLMNNLCRYEQLSTKSLLDLGKEITMFITK